MARVLGHEKVTVVNSVSAFGVGWGASIPAADAMGLQCTIQVDPVQGGSVRFWPDGTDPDGTTGFVLQSGDTMTFDLEIDKLKFIRESGTAGNVFLNVMYFKDV